MGRCPLTRQRAASLWAPFGAKAVGRQTVLAKAFCPGCGEQLDGDAVFCQGCGRKLC